MGCKKKLPTSKKGIKKHYGHNPSKKAVKHLKKSHKAENKRNKFEAR